MSNMHFSSGDKEGLKVARDDRRLMVQPFGYGISKSLRTKPRPTHKRYTLTRLREVGRKLGFKVVRLNEGFLRCYSDNCGAFETYSDEFAFNEMHCLHNIWQRCLPPIKPTSFKILVMDEKGRVIDELSQVKSSSFAPMSWSEASVIRWIKNTLRVGEAMQRDGRINGMPHLRRCEGARTDMFQLRKKLFQATHKPFAKEDQEATWSLIEQLLTLTEENLR